MRWLLVLFCVLLAVPAHGQLLGTPIKLDLGEHLSDAPEPLILDEIMPYVLMFRNDAEGKVSDADFSGLSIKFAELSYSNQGVTIGLCHWGENPRRIEFDKTYWDSASLIARWTLVYHELGHCVCNLEHTEVDNPAALHMLNVLGVHHERGLTAYLPDYCPNSLMHPTEFSDSCAFKHREMYVKQLFDKCQSFTVLLKKIMIQQGFDPEE